MNILVYRWNSYNYIDIIATFRSMGYQVDVIEQELESYDEDEAFTARLHGILQQKDYDFVFTVNYFTVISGISECQVDRGHIIDGVCLSDWAQTLIYLCEMTFTIAMTVGSVKGAQTLTSKAFGL